MNDSHRFRLALTARLLQIAALAAVGAPLAVAVGCGGKVVVDSSGGTGSGGEGGGVMTGPTSDNSSSTGTPDVNQCFAWDPKKPCPSVADAPMFLMLACQSVDGPGVFTQGSGCCYPVSAGGCGTGRPFVVAARARTAAAAPAGPARAWGAGAEPEVAALSAEDRGLLAAAWTRDALAEHASVASFARFSLELLAVGAPADLVAAAHEAAIDEVKHARLCFALAGAYAGAPIAPLPFPFGGAVHVAADLAEVAAATVREGCIGETLAALQAAEQLERAVDPAVRAALAVIAADEARHAELAWRTVAWALAQGGAPVRRAVAAAFAAAAAGEKADEPASAALAAHGCPGGARLHEAKVRALADVVGPCAQALLGGDPVAAVGASA